MIDLNDSVILEKIRKVVRTEGGRYLVEYMQSKIVDDFSPDTSKSFSEIGMDSVVCYNINKKLKEIIRFLTE